MGGCMEWMINPIVRDFKQKELLPVKILFFVHMSTILVLYPYLTIHMRELGINVEETAVMSSLTPVVGILMPPLAGLIADKIGNFKIMLTLFSMASGLSALLLLLIPIGRVTVTYPERVVLGMSCGAHTPLAFSLHEEFPCAAHERALTKDLRVETCGFVCHAYPELMDAADGAAILRARYFDVQLHNVAGNKTQTIRLTMPEVGNFTPPLRYANDDEITNHVHLQNDERYSATVRRYTRNAFFFPTPALFNFSCALQEGAGKDALAAYNNSHIEPGFDVAVENYECYYGNRNILRTLMGGMRHVNRTEDDWEEERFLFEASYLDLPQGKHSVHCAEGYGQHRDHLAVTVDLRALNDSQIYRTLDLGACATKCLATAPRVDFCSNPKRVIEKDIDVTFWSYLSVRVFIGIIGGTAYTMFEGAVIAILREYKADYGLQRMYAQLGGMISSPLSGLLIDYASQGKGYTDFRPIFFLYCGLKIASAVLMLFINLEFKTPAKSVVADVKSVIKLELISLFVAAFLLGSAWGYIESFLFWLLEDLGGTKSLMGLTITVGGVLGIPLLALSGPLINRFGHANIIFIGFLTYAVRLYGYSIIYNPWYSLIFEAMECLTHSLCFTALITYAARLSSVTTDTTIQGIIGGLFYGVGKSAGSLVGGYLIKFIGMRSTFQIFALVTGLTAFCYLAFYQFYMKTRTSVHPLEKEREKEPGAEHTNKAFDNTEMKVKNGLSNGTAATPPNEAKQKNNNDDLEVESSPVNLSNFP